MGNWGEITLLLVDNNSTLNTTWGHLGAWVNFIITNLQITDMLGRSQGKRGCDILIICPKYIPVKCQKWKSQPRTTKQFLIMRIDHSSAGFFSPGITTNIYKYYNNVAKQVQQPSIVHRCHSTKLAGALLPTKKHQKNPQWPTEQHLHPRWRPSLFWVPSHPVFSSLVLQAISHNWCFKP